MLETLFGMMYRQAKGRDGRPMLLNAYLFIGLGWICYSQFGLGWVALAVYAITLVNILSGYKSFTLPWVEYLFNILPLEHENRTAFFGFCPRQNMVRKKIKQLSIDYEKNNGFDTWHTCYRFFIPSIAICALTSWNWYWLGATVIAGALFPLSVKYWNTEEASQLREAVLGGVLIGGLLWV